MTGAELVREGRELMEAAGWVCGTANHNKPMPRGLKGWPLDLIAVRDDICIFFECKGEGDRLNKAQLEVMFNLHFHTGNHVIVAEIRDPRQFETYVNLGRL